MGQLQTFFMPSQIFSWPQVVTDLGKPREVLASGFLFPRGRRWMLSLSSAGSLWKSSGFSSLHGSPELSGCSWENLGRVAESLNERWCWGEGPAEDQEAGGKAEGLDEKGLRTQRSCSLPQCATAFYSLPETVQELHFLLLNFYLFSPHVLHSYWITYKPMNSCSFVLLPLYILN